MRLYLFPPSSRALGVVALKNHVALACELRPIDLGRGDQRAPEYVTLNPNQKMPTLEDGGFVLWESNAILFYLASKRPERALWPEDVRGQADVMRWLAWQSAHWDAESCGMVAFEKGSKAVLGLGAPEPAFIARGEANFARFAAVLDDHLKGRAWIVASGSRSPTSRSAPSCLPPTAWSSPSVASAKSVAGTSGPRLTDATRRRSARSRAGSSCRAGTSARNGGVQALTVFLVEVVAHRL